MEYIVVLLILIIGAFYFDTKKESRQKVLWFVLEWLILVLLAGLRYKVGGDTIVYQNNYESLYSPWDVFDSQKAADWGILWQLFVALCRFISKDFTFLQIFHAIVVNTIFLWFFRKKTSRYFLAILIYFVFYYFRFNTETMRSAFAVCCFLLSYDSLIQKKFLKYYFWVIIAIGFHTESVVLLFFPFIHILEKFKPNPISITFLIMLAACSLLFNFLPIIQNFASSFGDISEKASSYAARSQLGKGVSVLGYAHAFLANFTWLYIVILLYKEKHKKNISDILIQKNLFIGFNIIHFFFGILTLNYNNIFYRFQDFTSVITLVALCQVIEILTIRRYQFQRILLYSFLVILIVDRVLYFTSGAIILFYPYSSVFDPVDFPEREWYYNSVQ